MIKVLHCVSNMDRAGIETMLMNYYRNVNKKEIQFYFLCNKPKKGAYDDEILNMGGRIFVTPGLNPLKFLSYHKYVKKIIKDNRIDIVHVHNGAFGLQALIAAKKSSVKVRISHAHGTKIDKNFKLPLKLLYKLKLTKYANFYWGCGKEAIDYYYGKKATPSKTYLLKNAIDIDNFVFSPKKRETIRNKYNIKTDEIVIGHIGRFMKQKNHDYLIKIFKELYKRNKRYKLLLIGDGELQKDISNIVESSEIKNNVIFTGNVPNANEFYSAMDIFVLPSLFEGLPVVGIEAQTNGLNCLMSDTISNEIKITNNVYFLSISNNVNNWVDKIIEIGNKRNMINNEIEAAGYSIKCEAKKLEEKYKELLSK